MKVKLSLGESRPITECPRKCVIIAVNTLGSQSSPSKNREKQTETAIELMSTLNEQIYDVRIDFV